MHPHRSLGRSQRALGRLVAVAVAALATVASGLVTAPASAANVVTPGSFTGYGFDQCLAPTQASMNAWLRHSPYWAVGIYVSGDSRGCPSQPNLTPEWIATQLRKGWRLLPITLGPQAWCTTRERYLHQVRINPDASNGYRKARRQGRAEAAKTVGVASRLGIAPGSTLWYDIEAFDISQNRCRESALSFLSAWTRKLHRLGFVSGVYSSAASGVKMLDDAQALRPGTYAMPDQIWIADWNGRADVNSSYVRSSSWMPHRRVHQYRGGHNESYGGVTINIDNNWLDLGTGSRARRERHCDGVDVDFASYPRIRRGAEGALVTAAQCLLKEQGGYDGELTGVFDEALVDAVRAFRAEHEMAARASITRTVWTALLSAGRRPLLKYGAASGDVRRLQRALNAADSAELAVTGVFEGRTTAAVKRYQGDHRIARSGVVLPALWRLLQSGTR
jgi:peptidoglycan hydrolase-like protein with peptidoglycan-binding domain